MREQIQKIRLVENFFANQITLYAQPEVFEIEFQVDEIGLIIEHNTWIQTLNWWERANNGLINWKFKLKQTNTKTENKFLNYNN